MALIRRLIASRLVRYGFVLATIGLGGYAIAKDWRRIGPELAKIGLPVSLAALVVTLAALTASMWTWRVLLAGLGTPLSFRVAARVMFVGQLGKYLPGSVWPVLAQMELATEHGAPRARTASAGLVNMLVSLLSAMIAALATLPFTGGSTPDLWAFLIAPLLLACLHPRVLNHLLRLMFRLARRPPLEQPLTGRVIAAALGWSLVSWVLYGLAVWLLAVRVGIPAGVAVPLSIGAFALAFAVGFLVILAPAGAGVREVIMIGILSHPAGVPLGAAGAVAIVWRAVTVAGDVVVAAAALAYRRSHQGHAKAAADSLVLTASGSPAADAPERPAAR
jgi:glycosyltransferase 2 family protein